MGGAGATLVKVSRLVRVNGTAIAAVLDASKSLTGYAHWAVGCRVTTSHAVEALNRKYRGLHGPTDCLSFAATTWSVPGRTTTPEDAWPDLGDIVLAADVITADAVSAGADVEQHWRLTLLHSYVHLLGYDHETEAQAALMEPKVEWLLREVDRLSLPRITVPGRGGGGQGAALAQQGPVS